MGKAIELATQNIEEKMGSIRAKRDRLEDALLAELEDVMVVGNRENRTPEYDFDLDSWRRGGGNVVGSQQRPHRRFYGIGLCQ